MCMYVFKTTLSKRKKRVNEEQVNEAVAGEDVGSVTGFFLVVFQMGDCIAPLMLTYPVQRMTKTKTHKNSLSKERQAPKHERKGLSPTGLQWAVK